MKFRYDSYCGLYCGACAVLIANREENLEEKAQEWNMDPADLRCAGCKSDETSIYCMDCDIRECAENKKVDFCFQCAEYPCERLIGFRNDKYAHHSIILKNLETIKEGGAQRWLDEQELRWTCPECGTKFSWYDEACKTCGSTLYNSVAEEKDIS